MNSKEIITIGGMEIRICLEANDMIRQLTVYECMLHTNALRMIPHYHQGFDETIYGLKGITTFYVDGKTIEIGPEDSIFIPRGATHSFANNTREEASFLCIANPVVLGADYFKLLAAVINSANPNDPDKLRQVMAIHEIIPSRKEVD